MKYVCFLLCLLVVLSGCSCDALCRREVTVVLPDVHPWERCASGAMWYTLAWNDDGGTVRRCHIPSGVRRVTVSVPRGGTVFFCAYPLGTYYPFGSALVPSAVPSAALTQDEGALCSAFLDLAVRYPDAVGTVNYPLVLRKIRSVTDDPSGVDMVCLARDVLNGEVTDASFVVLGPLSVRARAVLPGRWVGERARDGSFWYRSLDDGIDLLLTDGLHCFLNREDGLLLKAFADRRGNRSFVSLHTAPLW